VYVSLRLPLAALAIGAVAAVAHRPGPVWAILAGGNLLLLLAVAVDVRLAPRAGSMQVERDAPEVLSMGRPARLAVRLHNPASRPVEVGIRDAAPPSLGREPRRHRAVVEPGAWERFEAEVRPTRRGHASVGPITVRTSGPLRLAGRQATLPVTGRLKVYPALPSRAEVELRLQRARLLEIGQRSSAIRGGGTDFDSLREYHPDDEFRRINWRATARAARPITNVYRQERNQQVVLLVDASRMMATTFGGFSRLEYALDAGIAVAELAAHVGDQVGLVAFAGRVVSAVGPKGGRVQPRRLLEALFALEPSLESANYREAFSALLARHRRRALLVLLTELTEESALEPLLEALPALLARHLVLVGAVADPDVAAQARAAPSSSEDVYLKAAAAASADARDRAGARLRRMGAVVVDRPPGKLAGELADQYLRIKAFGRL